MMIKIKSFIRALNNKERKSLYNICFATLFQCISYLLMTILLLVIDVNPLTLICIQGCFLTLMSFFRLLVDFHEDPTLSYNILEVKMIKKILYMGVMNFLVFVLTVVTLKRCCMSTLFLIFRLSQFISILFVKKGYMYIKEWLAFLVSLIVFLLIIYWPSYYKFGGNTYEHTKGITYAIVACIILSYLSISHEKDQAKFVDLQIFVLGILSSTFGFIGSTYVENDLYLSFWSWILVLIGTAFNYFGIYFKIKTIKALAIYKNFIPFNLASIIVTLIFGLIFFGQKISTFYVVALFLTFANVIIYSKYDAKKADDTNIIKGDF